MQSAVKTSAVKKMMRTSSSDGKPTSRSVSPNAWASTMMINAPSQTSFQFFMNQSETVGRYDCSP